MARHLTSNAHGARMHSMVLALLGASVLLSATSLSLAGSRKIRFQNKTGQDVNDLHVETKQGVTITSKSPFTRDSGVSGGSKHDFSDGTVAKEPVGGPPNEAVIEFDSGSPDITIKKDGWWWTKDGDRVGDKHSDTGGAVLSCAGGQAFGDGLVYVSIDHREGFFQTQRGATPELTTQMFADFCSSFFDVVNEMPLIQCTPLDPRQLELLGNVLGNPETALQIQIVHPDGGQSLELLPIDTGIELAIQGTCPGRISAIVTNAVPGSPVILAYSLNDRSGTPVPGCAGVQFSLRNATIVGQVPADLNGTAIFRGNVPQAACGRLKLQASEQARCVLTRVVGL